MTIRPKYEAGLLLAFPFFGFCILVLGGSVISDPLDRPMLTFAVVLFVTTLPFVATLLISEIRFRSEAFEVDFYLRPNRVVRYDEVLDLGSNLIQTKRGILSLSSMKNGGDVIQALLSRLSDGQLSGEMIEAHSYMPATFVVGLVLWPLLYLALGAAGLTGEWLTLATLLGWAVGLAPSFYVVGAFYRRKYT